MHQIIKIFSFLLCFSSYSVLANISGFFVPNHGQWHADVLYKTSVPGADVWFTKNGIIYSHYSQKDLSEIHHHECEGHHEEEEHFFRGHAYQMLWGMENTHFDQLKVEDIQADPKFYPEEKQTTYFNYLLGNESANWAAKVPVYKKLKVDFPDLPYSYEFLFENGQLKYNIWLNDAIHVDQFHQTYRGLESVSIESNNLVLQHSYDRVIEQIPYSYQLIDGDTIEVNCSYVVKNNRVEFQFNEKLREGHPICIDPIVVASTFTGASIMTLGHSATYDQVGNVYGAGRPIGVGFPTTLGAYKYSYSGSWNDIGITKFNEDGSDLIWATYLGGTLQDFAHSIIVNSKRELVIYGKTNSVNFPTLENSYDDEYAANFDIFVSVLSADGSSLQASTYLGGSGDDGHNVIDVDAHDNFKGEVIVDKYDNIYIASSSSSTDLFLENGFDTVNNGYQDGLLVKFDPALSNMIWGNYLGGDDLDVLLGLKVHPNGDVYTCGVTSSYNYPATTNVYQQNYGGGTTEGVISCVTQDGAQLKHSTFYGGVYKDELLFIEIDKSGDIYCLGESDTETTTPGKYEGPSAISPTDHKGVVVKFDSILQNKYWASVFHRMNFTAFLVDNCYRIYTSGYHPSMNLVDITGNNVGSANQGFYLMVLEPDATAISFGSFYGGNTSHVDGGTSRFDKRGVITQATCTLISFPLNSNAWSDNVNGTYDMALFKIDMETDMAAAFAAPIDYPFGCLPFELDMTSTGSQGTGMWLIDSVVVGSADTLSYSFNTTGTHEVMYVVQDSNTCNVYDTAVFYVQVESPEPYAVETDTSRCRDVIQLELIGNIDQFQWANGSDSNITSVANDTVFWLSIQNECGIIVDSFYIDVLPSVDIDMVDDTAACDSILLELPYDDQYNYTWENQPTQSFIKVGESGTYSYQLNNGVCAKNDSIDVVIHQFEVELSDTNTCLDSILLSVNSGESTPLLINWYNGSHKSTDIVTQSGTYWVELDFGDCKLLDSAKVELTDLKLALDADSVICEPQIASAIQQGGGAIEWFNGDTTTHTIVDQPGWVWVTVSKEECYRTDSIFVNTIDYHLADSTYFCEGDEVYISVGEDYPADITWSNGATGNSIVVNQPGYYVANIENQFCKTEKGIWVDEQPLPYFDLGEDIITCYGDPIWLTADVGADSYTWSNGRSGSNIQVSEAASYSVVAELRNCTYEDSISVSYRSELAGDLFYQPNIITPNFDGRNDKLRFLRDDIDPAEIGEYHLLIYNRWGNLVFETTDPLTYWEGFNQENSQLVVGTYFYIINYRINCNSATYREIKGTVSLLR